MEGLAAAAIDIEADTDAEFLVFVPGQASRVGWTAKPGLLTCKGRLAGSTTRGA
jgi:hypothetical protein